MEKVKVQFLEICGYFGTEAVAVVARVLRPILWLKMASEAISEHLISKNFLWGSMPQVYA